MHIGLVGYGIVGRALARFFGRSSSMRVSVYDKYLPEHSSLEHLLAVNCTDIAFVAVPTPYDGPSGTCDISAVEEAVDNLTVPACIKSTIPPGTVDALIARTGKHVAFSPEYIGESAGHPWPEADGCGFAVFGGDTLACDLAQAAYERVAMPGTQYVRTSAVAAELAKYMENAYLASKVAFVNLFYDFAAAAGADFEEVRSVFLLDSRIGESHTRISEERGFGGKCLPKDVRSIVAWAKASGLSAPLLEAVLHYNERVRSVNA